MGKGDIMFNISMKQLAKTALLFSSAAVFIWVLSDEEILKDQTNTTSTSYIISAKNYDALQQQVAEMHLKPTHELSIINALALDLTPEQLTRLQSKIKVQVSANHQVKLSGWNKGQRRWQPRSVVADYIGASDAHHYYNFGDGVTIGFLDTGLDQLYGLSNDLYGRDKAWGTYDAINNTVSNYDNEASGHGTHVASIAGNSDYDINGKIYGIAPNAPLVGIKAFDADGKATYADVIRGIQWALSVKDQINLRVLNMSFSAPVSSYYWEDPLNQAVMKAWQAGIVVVASAGNKGPDPMSIGVPGNVPYIITVGAMTDNYSSEIKNDDFVASFSSSGPTFEGFVKPEIVAPGGHISGLMSYDSQIVIDHPEFSDGGRYFEMSGTSQAAAVVSGAVALLLTENPALTPDEVKCKLMASAHPALKADGSFAYSVFQQGSGVINVKDALASSATSCANQSLNIAQDLLNQKHFYGPTNINSDGNFYIEGLGEEYVWNVTHKLVDGDTFVWKTNVSTDTFVWKTSFGADTELPWRTNFEAATFVWKTNVTTDTFVWKTNIDFNNTENISINNWVAQQ